MTTSRATEPESAGGSRRRTAWRRARWVLLFALLLAFLELVARRYIARPNRLLTASSDPDLVYAMVPGTWFGRIKFDVWRLPVFMIFDLLRKGEPTDPAAPPPGWVVYRIDQDGCRQPAVGDISRDADVVFQGSSNGFGILLPYEDSVGAMLESTLRARGFVGARVANCGAVGYHVVPALRATEALIAAKHPKVAVFLVRPWHTLAQVDYTKVLVPEQPALRWLIDRSSFARVAFYVHKGYKNQWIDPPVAPEQLREKIARYASVADAAGVRTVVFLLYGRSKDEPAMLDPLVPLFEERGITVKHVDTPDGPPDLFIDPDHHWSAKGARVTTDTIVEAVATELARASAARGALPDSTGP